MSVSLELSAKRTGAGADEPRAPPELVLGIERGPSLWRYAPLVLLVTASVIVIPPLVAGLLVAPDGPASAALSIVLAVILSLALASAEAAAWKRRRAFSDVVFADLMLWGWVRRCWAERHLASARALYESARRSGGPVNIELLTAMNAMLLARDSYTYGHSERVARHAERIARAMHLDSAVAAKVRTAAAVHDVGKLYTPREILNNPRRLTRDEFEVMKRHAADGAEMLAGAGDPEIATIVRHHHERVDGTGYPDGLAGPAIPLGARIIAVADTFDSITSNRAYRSAATQKKALSILRTEAGAQLDAGAVAAFCQDYSARRPAALLALASAAAQRALVALQSASSGIGSAVGSLGSIVPALGAAGLLAAAPALHQHRGSEPIAAAPASVTTALRHSAPSSRSLRRAATVHHARGPAASIRAPSPGSGSVRRPATSSSPATSPSPSTGTSPPGSTGAPAGGESITIPSPPHTPSQPIVPAPPPTGSPPVPSVPSLPVTPPVKLPTVTTPSIPTPAGNVPSVTTPSVSVGPISTPSIDTARPTISSG